MPSGFSLSDDQKKAFADLIANKSKEVNGSPAHEVNFDAFDALVGQDKVLTVIKSRLPVSFSGVSLFLVDASNSKDVLLGLAKFCSAAGYTPVLVLFAGNYKAAAKMMRGANFSGRYLVLDCVSNSIASVEESKDVFFVDSVRDLTQIQIKVLKILRANPKAAFIFDSMLVLSLYHSPDVVLKFISSFTKLIRKERAPAHFIASGGKNTSKFTQFFDETVELAKFY